MNWEVSCPRSCLVLALWQGLCDGVILGAVFFSEPNCARGCELVPGANRSIFGNASKCIRGPAGPENPAKADCAKAAEIKKGPAHNSRAELFCL